MAFRFHKQGARASGSRAGCINVIRMYALKVLIVSGVSGGSLFAQACSDSSNFEGAYEEDDASGRLLSEVDSTRRYGRMQLLQFDTTLGGIIEYFEVGSFDEFKALPDDISTPLQYHHCYRVDAGYVRADTLYVNYTDSLQQRWQFRLAHHADKYSVIQGTVSRLAYNDRVVEINSEQDGMLLEEDQAWLNSDLKNRYAQISMTERKDTVNNTLDCLGYYRDHTFYVTLPDEIASGKFCSPSAERCNNLRLGIILTRLDGTNIVTQEYLTSRLDAYDIDPEHARRKLRLREMPDLYATSNGNIAIATVIVYVDNDENGHWTEAEDTILAGLRNSVLIFAPEKSHEVIQTITGTAARFDEIMVQPVMTPWTWKVYKATFEQSRRVSLITGLGSVHELPMVLESTLDEQGKGCLLPQNGVSLVNPCRGLLPIGGMP